MPFCLAGIQVSTGACVRIPVHTILYYTIRLPVFDGHEKKERLSVLRVI